MSDNRWHSVPLDRGVPRRAFVDAVLAGEAFWWDLDEWVGQWHALDTDPELHEWLGMTFEEYSVLGDGDRYLAAILYSRRHSVPLSEALAWFSTEPVAARGDGDPQRLQEVLVREGLVEV